LRERLGKGSAASATAYAALGLARTCDLELATERTAELWVGRPKPKVEGVLL
jgi:hypothetical protein